MENRSLKRLSKKARKGLRKRDARLIKLLIRAHRFNATLDADDLPFAAVAKRESVSPSYFTRLVRLS